METRTLSTNSTKKKRTVEQYHNYYKRTGFYSFLFRNLFWLLLTVAALIGLILIFQSYVEDFDTFFKSILRNLNLSYVFVIFFISESLLGLIPPDIFILWTKTLAHPYLNVALLAGLSYLGGINSYYLGKLIHKIPTVKEFVLKKEKKHYKQIKKWGSWLIIIAALFPLPFAIVCILSGMLDFPFKRFLLITVTRILRFFIFAFLLYGFIHL